MLDKCWLARNGWSARGYLALLLATCCLSACLLLLLRRGHTGAPQVANRLDWQVFAADGGDLFHLEEEAEDEESVLKQAVGKQQSFKPTKGADRRSRRSVLARRNESMRFVLMCQVLDGELPVQIKWFKEQQELSELLAGRLLQEEQQLELLSSDELGSSLLFRRVQPQHSGNYTCLATNQFGSASYSSFMSVKVPPRWRLEPRDQQSIMGEQVTVDCQASGNPNPFIRWKFTAAAGVAGSGNLSAGSRQHPAALAAGDDLPEAGALNELLASGAFKQINSNHHVQTLENGSLSIRQATREHEGLYLCEADNGIEPALVKAVRLQVHLQAQFLDEIQALEGASTALEPPPSKQPLVTGNKQVAASTRTLRALHNASQVRLLCQPLGEPPLSVEWLKDGQLIYTHSSAAPADLSSAGSAPSSGAGSSPAAAMALAAQSSAFASAPGNSQHASFNHHQLLDLTLSSRYHVSTRRSALRANQLDSELLLAGGLRRADAGVFTCAARNAFGQAERRLRLVVQEPPEAPEVVDVEHISSRSIGLRWLAPFDGNSPILKYLVEYRRLGGSDAQPEAPESQSEKVMAVKLGESGGSGSLQVQHTVHELDPLTRYSMRVVAVNGVGRSRASVALSLRTEEEVPSVVPINVEVAILSSKSIKLHWTISYAPEHELIDGFFLGYRSFEAAQLLDNASSAPAKLSAATNEQQPNYFTYKTIRLTNQQSLEQAGSQAAQPEDNGDRDDRPQTQSYSMPTYLSPVASVTKSVPAQSSSSHHGGSQLHHTNVISTFEYVVSGLERNTEYTILIQCFNKKGAGPTSDPVVFKTYMNDPPEKLALNVDEVSESSVRVSWRFLTNLSPIEQAQTGLAKQNDLLDGYVLSFAKLSARKFKYDSSAPNKPPHLNEQLLSSSSSALNRSAAAARISASMPHQSAGGPEGLEQWQAVQLAPLQRNHQLKNLECGTSYAMRIWAFNKIGKGEPSDLLTISTRGKAPVAPDRRSFISVNSTQVRLYLSAWYDGGCEIDKFAIQYRVRGQQEWMLVSNNILKEQVSLLIKDLLPATSYELLASAQNQVGPTEMKYKFTTLDLNGKPVTSSGLSFLGNAPELDEEDYDGDEATKRDFWPGSELSFKSVLVFRHLLNSPLALVLSLILFAALLFLLLFYRFGAPSSQLEESLPSSNKSYNGNPPRSSCDGNTTIADNDGPLSLANGSLTDSPRINLQSGSPNRLHGIHSHLNECLYQTYCPPANSHRSNQVPAGYGHAECPPCAPSYGQTGNYALSGQRSTNLHRSATLDPLNSGLPASQDSDSQQQQQQCLMQMLMMGTSQPQQDRPLFDPNSGSQGSYATAALTMGRAKANGQITNMSSHNYAGSQLYGSSSNNMAATLGRQQLTNLDLQRQQHVGCFAVSHSNNPPTATYKQQQSSENSRLEEVYPMSTFKRNEPCSRLSHTATSSSNYFSTNSTSSTSGCETMPSTANDLDQNGAPDDRANRCYNEQEATTCNASLNLDRLPVMASSLPSEHPEGPNNNNNTVRFDSKSCDKSSNYDVPFKSIRNSNSMRVELDGQIDAKSQICY